MNTENFWPCIESLARQLDGNRASAEAALDRIENELLRQPRPARDELRRRMMVIVESLARLEVRMVGADGPLQATV